MTFAPLTPGPSPEGGRGENSNGARGRRESLVQSTGSGENVMGASGVTRPHPPLV